MLPAPIQVVEVGPRDGPQNEAVSLAAADKVAFVPLTSCAEAGLQRQTVKELLA